MNELINDVTIKTSDATTRSTAASGRKQNARVY